MKYAWFTVGLPETTPRETVALLKKNGYQGVEWRIVNDNGDTRKPGFWSGNRCTLQANWSNEQFKEVARMTADAGLAVPNLGTYIRAHEIGAVERMMEVAKIFNSPSIRVGSAAYDGKKKYNELLKKDIERFARVQKLAQQYRVKALIEIHMGLITPSASAAYRLVSHFSPAHIGIIHDAGNMVYEGYENYKMGVEILGKYLAHVHIKNSIVTSKDQKGPQKKEWATSFGPFRKGAVNFTTLLKAMKSAGYNGWLSFEDFSTEMTQAQKVKDNLLLLKTIVKGL